MTDAREKHKLSAIPRCRKCGSDETYFYHRPGVQDGHSFDPMSEPVASPQATITHQVFEGSVTHPAYTTCHLCPSVAQPAAGTTPSSIEWSRNHLVHVQQFLIEMYQTMVDPVDEFHGNIAQLCELLLKRAREDREALNQATQSSEGTTPQAERPACECGHQYDRHSRQMPHECRVGENTVCPCECVTYRAVAPVETPEQKSSTWTPKASYDAMKAILDEAEWFEPIVMPIFLPDWLQERLENCCRLAAQKTGDDKREWLVDALYFKLAVDAVSSFYAEKLDDEVLPCRRG